MIGVYIPSMEMPKSCGGCPMQDRHNEVCRLHDEDYGSWCEEYKHCPILPVPDHGRLIDADALLQALYIDPEVCDIRCQEKWGTIFKSEKGYIDGAPTIIPADKGVGE